MDAHILELIIKSNNVIRLSFLSSLPPPRFAFFSPPAADVASWSTSPGTVYLCGCLQPAARHTVILAWSGVVEVDHSADPSTFSYWGKHCHLLDRFPPPLFFLPIAIPRQPTRRKGVGEGKARTHPHILYCTRCARRGCCRQHEVNTIGCPKLEIISLYPLKTEALVVAAGLFTSLVPVSKRSLKSHQIWKTMSAGMYEIKIKQLTVRLPVNDFNDACFKVLLW